jgi:hypothetical protein
MSDEKRTNGTSIEGAWLRDYDLGHVHAERGNYDPTRNRLSSGYRTGVSDYNAGIRVWTGTVKNPSSVS